VAGETVVMVERVERWNWKTGEQVDLPIASVVEISGSKISRWIDYWDMQTLLGVAPAWWVEHVMQDGRPELVVAPPSPRGRQELGTKVMVPATSS